MDPWSIILWALAALVVVIVLAVIVLIVWGVVKGLRRGRPGPGPDHPARRARSTTLNSTSPKGSSKPPLRSIPGGRGSGPAA